MPAPSRATGRGTPAAETVSDPGQFVVPHGDKVINFVFPAEDDPRRIEIRQWLEANPNPSFRQLAERGYTAPNWPPPWGLSAGPELVLILDEELERAGIAHPRTKNGIGLNQCGQSLLTWGTEEQRERFLPPA